MINRSVRYKNRYVHRRDSLSLANITLDEKEKLAKIGAAECALALENHVPSISSRFLKTVVARMGAYLVGGGGLSVFVVMEHGRMQLGSRKIMVRVGRRHGVALPVLIQSAKEQ